jgi:Flp pilus assembly protein TadG
LRRPARHPVLADRRGAALVEFALVAAPFIALMLAIIQTSLTYFVQEALESAVEAAARGIVTGRTQAADLSAQTGGMTQAQLAERFRKSGCGALPAFLSCDRLYVDVRSAATGSDLTNAVGDLTFDKAGALTTKLSYDYGGQGAIVMVRFIYLWPFQIAPLAGLGPNGSGPMVLMATSVAKSEAFG